MKVTDYIVEFLQRKGIHDFFGYQGTMIAHLVDSIEKNPHTRSHSSYHEQGAAFAACGYAQAGERCACAYATSGPGAANLISGIADAYFDSLPVVFLTGQLNTYEYSGIPGLRQQGFQEIDIVAMAKPVTKYAVQIREDEDIVKELNKAYHIASVPGAQLHEYAPALLHYSPFPCSPWRKYNTILHSSGKGNSTHS